MADKTTPPDPLDQLASQAELDQIDPTGSPGEPGQPEPAGITNAQAFAGAMAAGREAFCFFTKLESPRRVLNDDRIGQISGLADPVLTKHGINLGAYLGDFGPEIALAVATFGLVAELRAAVNAEIQAKTREIESALAPAAAEIDPAPADGQ
jgi:hypothetical protein